MRLSLSPALLVVLSLSAGAVDWDDPLATAAGLSPRPAAASSCAAALPAAPLTVTDAVDLALCNHPQTREVWANARVQAAQLGVAQSAWLPSVDGKVAASRVWKSGTGTDQDNAALTVSWLLLDFGGRAANAENARQLLTAAAATQDATVQQIFLAALQAYYGAQASQAAVAAALEAEKASRESYLAADARYRVGVATPSDRMQAQTAWSQASLNRIRSEGDARNARGVLANALGFDAQQPVALAELPVQVPEAAFERDVADLIEAARQRRPDLRAAEAQVNAAQASVAAARASGLPTVSVAAGPTWQQLGSQSASGGVVGVTLNLPLFSGFNTTYRVRAAEAQVEVKGAQRDRLRQQVALDVWRAYQSLMTATQALKTSADLVASAEAAEAVALGRYKAGVGNILDVLNAQSALASARQQRIQASLDWNVFRASLAQAMGALDYSVLQSPAQGKKTP